jgi:hypothetical protein
MKRCYFKFYKYIVMKKFYFIYKYYIDINKI